MRFPEDSVDPGELVKYAGIAMYAAKAAGKNRFSKFLPDMLKGI